MHFCLLKHEIKTAYMSLMSQKLLKEAASANSYPLYPQFNRSLQTATFLNSCKLAYLNSVNEKAVAMISSTTDLYKSDQ